MKTAVKSRNSQRGKARRKSAAWDEQYHQAALHLSRILREGVMPAVVFASTTSGEGTSTTVVEVARHLRDGFGLNPLVLRIGKSERHLRSLEVPEDEHSRQDLLALSNGQVLPNCVKPGHHSIPTITRSDPPAISKRTMRLQAAISRVLRDRQPDYNAVLIDAPAILESTDTMAVCEIVPQVVLVVAAGQTRSEVVDRVTDELEEHEIAIVGTILNKQKRVIPEWFYRSFLK